MVLHTETEDEKQRRNQKTKSTMSKSTVGRVLVTGLGGVTPLGNSIQQSWTKLVSARGETGIQQITSLPDYETNYKPFTPYHFPETLHVGAVDFDQVVATAHALKNIDSDADLKKYNKATVFLLNSVSEAFADSGIDLSKENVAGFGSAIGTGIGSIEDTYDSMLTFCNVEAAGGGSGGASGVATKKRRARVSPYAIPKILPNVPPAYVHMKYGFQGPLLAFSSACATGTQSIGEGYLRMLYRGKPEVMVVGASESSVHPLSLTGFHRARSLSVSGVSRPFDTNRDGFVLSEGCGVLVLEQFEHWKSRAVQTGSKSKVYAEVCGYGCSTDAHHITAPHPEGEGAYQSMRECLPAELANEKEEDQAAPPKTIYINCHSTSTKLGDAAEIKAITRLFGNSKHRVLLSSNKGHMGHLLGAAGSVESIFALKTLTENKVPATLNLQELDPKIKEMLEPYGGRIAIIDSELANKLNSTDTNNKINIDYAIKNSFGFGGINTSICFKKFIE